MSVRVLLAGALACVAAAPAVAGPLVTAADYKAVADKPVAEIDPALSYIMVRTLGPTALTFIRRPEQVEIDDYLKRRAAALVKAHGKWVKKHASWQSAAASWDKGSAETKAALPRPVEPVEPTDANLAFAPIERENMISIGPFNRFAKGKGEGSSVFLHRVPPGHYSFYGPVYTVAQPAGTCLCMGSFGFDVKPGRIVDVGTMKLNWIAARAKAKEEGKPLPRTDMDLPDDINAVGWEPPVAGAAVDPRLATFTVEPGDLHAAGRVPNYYGVTIDRMSPISGVLAYDRDTVVDVKTGARLR